MDGNGRGAAWHDGGVAPGVLVVSGASGDRELEGARSRRRGGDQSGQVELAVGEDLDGRGQLVGRAVADPGDGEAFPVVADLLAALHELVGDQFDVARRIRGPIGG